MRFNALCPALAGIEPHFANVLRTRRQLLQQFHVGAIAGTVCKPPGMEACSHADVRAAREALARGHGIVRGDGRAEQADTPALRGAGDLDAVRHEIEVHVHVDEPHRELPSSSIPAIRLITNPASMCPMMGGR